MLSKERILDELAAWARPGREQLREALAGSAARERLVQWLDSYQDPDLFPEYRDDAPVSAYVADAVLARVFSDARPCGDGYAQGAGKAFVDLLAIAYVQNTVLLPPSERRAAFSRRIIQLKTIEEVREIAAAAEKRRRAPSFADVVPPAGSAMPAPSAAAPKEAGEAPFGALPEPEAPAAPAPCAFERGAGPDVFRPRRSPFSRLWSVAKWGSFAAASLAGVAVVATVVLSAMSPSYETVPYGPLPAPVTPVVRPGQELPPKPARPVPPSATGATAGTVSGEAAPVRRLDAARAALKQMWKDNQAELAVAAGGTFVLFFSSVLKEGVNALVGAVKGSAAAVLGWAWRVASSLVVGALRATARRRHRRGSGGGLPDALTFAWAWYVLRPLGCGSLREEISSALLQVADALKRDADLVTVAARDARAIRGVRDAAREQLRGLADGRG